MSDATVVIGLSITVVFTALFALAPLPKADDDEESDIPKSIPLATRVGGTLLPFLAVLTFVFRDDVVFHGWPTLVLVTLASVGSLFVARRESMAGLGLAGAVLAASITAAFALRSWGNPGDFWPLLALLLLVPAIFHGAFELDRFENALTKAAAAVPVVLVLVTLAIVPNVHTVEPYALIGVFLFVLVLGLRQSAVIPRTVFPLVLALLSAITAFVLEMAFFTPRGSPSGSFLLACEVLPLVLFTVAAVRAREGARATLDHATLLGACATLLLLALRIPTTGAFEWISMALALTLTFVLGLAATGRAAQVGFAIVVIGCAALTVGAFTQRSPSADVPELRLVLLFALVAMSTAWPFLARRVGASPWGWRAAALAGPAFFFPLRRVWVETLGDSYLGALPVILGVIVLVTAMGARRRTDADPETQRTATVWLAAVATGFATLAIPLQLSNEWLTIGWALEAAALLALDSRLKHVGLRYFAFALYLAVVIRLSPIPYLLEYHPRGDWRILNWLSYTYLVPAASLLAGSFLLSRHEVASRPAFEVEALGAWAKKPIQASVLFGGLVAVVFVWLNLTIIDWYSTSTVLTIPTDLVPARGLTISAAWALYALLLLALGMRQSSSALRITSLLLMIATIAKVFLHDTSNLGDLYRVASFVFLALSLIAVSFFYQRFVFKRRGAS